MQRLDNTEPMQEFNANASKVVVIKNVKANTRSVSVNFKPPKDKEMKETLIQSLPTTSESLSTKKPEARPAQ